MSAGILTPDQRLRVFVSSTMEELAEERRAARRAVERLQLAPVMFELGARPHPPRSLYLAYLRQSHVFVGVYWQRYGWVAPGTEVSGLEDELRHSTGMPRLVYLKVPAPELDPRLATMLDTIRTAGDVSYKSFRTPEELENLLAADLAVLLTERFLAEPAGSGEALELGRRVRDESLVMLVDISLVIVHGGLGDETGARVAGQEALRLARAAGDRWGEAYALTGLGFLDVALGRFAGREGDFDAMLDAARACEDPVCLAIALGNCGELRLATGDVAAAAGLLGDSLRLCGQFAMVYAGSFSLDSAAAVLASVGEHATAIRIEAAAEVAMHRVQAAWWQPRVARRDRLLAEARQRLGAGEYAVAWDDGSRLTFRSGIEVATAALQGRTSSSASASVETAR